MVSIQYLAYFMKICETHSMNRAAAELYITQPALSQAVRKLEDGLGVTLFKRSNKGIGLTKDGEVLLRHCIQLMKQMELIENMAQRRPEPVLAVSAFPYIIHPGIFLKLKNNPAFSGMRLEYEEGRVLHVFENLYSSRSQLGIIQFNNYQEKIIGQKAEDYGLSISIIAATPWAVALGPKSPLYNNTDVSFEELKDHRLIRMKDDLVSFITGELEVDNVMVGELPYDKIHSCAAAEFLLTETLSYMFCGMHNPFASPASGLKVLKLKNCNVHINIALALRKQYKPEGIELLFLDLLKESLNDI